MQQMSLRRLIMTYVYCFYRWFVGVEVFEDMMDYQHDEEMDVREDRLLLLVEMDHVLNIDQGNLAEEMKSK